jgi:hypothetical protein
MFFDSKFSILKAYLVSFKINLEHIAFYLVWEIIAWILGFAMMIYFAISMDILDPLALTQDYTIAFKYFSQLFTDFLIQKEYKVTTIAGHEPYDIFKLLVPENILNHNLDGVSWSEYFNVILVSKKIMLSLGSIFSGIIAMTMSVGYIKTALNLQSGQKASFHDMYQNFHW